MAAAGFIAALVSACSREQSSSADGSQSPSPSSILLVTLDTTRADAIGPSAQGVETPAFNALAARGMLFRRAYAAVPETLPSHTTMMTGLYPAAHGVHENARNIPQSQSLVAERLGSAGYTTAAFISAYPLDRRFGIARGFETYDDDLGSGGVERSAKETTDRALSWLAAQSGGPLFLWVHYFDPHHPYDPPEPFRSRYASNPYLGEVAAMDQELGRLVAAFEQREGNGGAVIVVGDHGEALGEHGESQHGHLLYEGVMRVPLAMAGAGITVGTSDDPVSTRRVFHTLLDLAGLGSELTLRQEIAETVAGEAMKPFLNYGWQPQVMAIEGRIKAILAGQVEVYDVVADAAESTDLSQRANLSRDLRRTLREYPVSSLEAAPLDDELNDEERRQLASLGYVSSSATPVVRKDAPRPVDMTHIFGALDRASGLFVNGEYQRAIPVLEEILAADPHNLMAVLRLAAAQSNLGHHQEALASFRRAQAIAPASSDVHHYLALHYLSTGEWQKAEPLLEQVLAKTPDRLPALEGMATVREQQGRPAEALRLRQQAIARKTPSAAELIRIGQLAMAAGNTPAALGAFERARSMQGPQFRHDLELGVLYLESRRLSDARAALDRVPSSHPGYPMALFKRAQVSVLLGEPDSERHIRRARENADTTTAPLIARERLFASGAEAPR